MDTMTEPKVADLIALAEDAESRVASAPSQDEREMWQRKADEWWRAVCDAETR